MVDQCLLMFKALSDENRQKIIRILSEGLLNVGEIVNRISLAQPTISHHLSILKMAGVVITEKRGKQTYYKLCCGPETMSCCSEVFRLLGVKISEQETEKEKDISGQTDQNIY